MSLGELPGRGARASERAAQASMDHDAQRDHDEQRAGPWTRALRWLGGRLVRLPAALLVALPLAWMAFIWFLSSQSIDTPGGAFGLWGFLGNLAHAPLFGCLALFWTALFLRSPSGVWPPLSGRVRLAVVLLVAGYGALDELHQRATSGRQASVLDVVTDLVGALCVLWIVGYLGAPGAAERGLWLRLCAAGALCALVAWLGLL